MPVRLIGRNVRAMLHASELVVYDGRDEVARHERLIAKGGTRLELDHYLEALVRKPGAFPGATALDQARSAGRFTPVHDAWWDAAVKAHGERDGTRALIEVLLLGRHLPHEHLVTGLAAALKTAIASNESFSKAHMFRRTRARRRRNITGSSCGSPGTRHRQCPG